MTRKLASVTVLVAAALTVTVPAAAQTPNTIGRGPITPTHLPVYDSDGTPGPSAGDTPIPMGASSNSVSLFTPAGSETVGLSNFDGSGRPRTFTIVGPSETQTITMTNFNGLGQPTGFSLTAVHPAGGATRTGTASLNPLNSQLFHDGISGSEIGGDNFSFNASFAYAPLSGETRASYISIPLATQLAIAQNVEGGGSGGLTNQYWAPLTDTGQIVLELPGGPPFLSSPVIAPVPGAGQIITNVPTLSGMGLIAFSAALLTVGWLQLRRGGLSLG